MIGTFWYVTGHLTYWQESMWWRIWAAKLLLSISNECLNTKMLTQIPKNGYAYQKYLHYQFSFLVAVKRFQPIITSWDLKISETIVVLLYTKSKITALHTKFRANNLLLLNIELSLFHYFRSLSTIFKSMNVSFLLLKYSFRLFKATRIFYLVIFLRETSTSRSSNLGQ